MRTHSNGHNLTRLCYCYYFSNGKHLDVPVLVGMLPRPYLASLTGFYIFLVSKHFKKHKMHPENAAARSTTQNTHPGNADELPDRQKSVLKTPMSSRTQNPEAQMYKAKPLPCPILERGGCPNGLTKLLRAR